MPREFRFRVRKDGTRATSPWVVDIPGRFTDTGKRQRRFFESQEKAKGEIQFLRARVTNHGIASKLLSPAQEELAAVAYDLLKAAGMEERQLVAIVQNHIAQEAARTSSVTLLECWNAYIERARGEGRSDKHLDNLERNRDRFAPFHAWKLPDITAEGLEKQMAGLAASYRNAILRELRAVFNFAASGTREWVSFNPANKIEFIKRTIGEAQIYSPAQIEALLAWCREHDRELIPAMVLMTFCGVRPDPTEGEIVKLEWDHVFMEDTEPRLELPASATKAKKRRSVTLRTAPKEWLQWWVSTGGKPEGMIVEPAGEPLRKRLRAVFEGAKVARIQDGLRKSFASYLSKSESKAAAIRELGHAGGELLDRHYRSDIAASEAAKFWNILPPPIKGVTITHIKKARKTA
jgi:integrase/recombinase XerD